MVNESVRLPDRDESANFLPFILHEKNHFAGGLHLEILWLKVSGTSPVICVTARFQEDLCQLLGIRPARLCVCEFVLVIQITIKSWCF